MDLAAEFEGVGDSKSMSVPKVMEKWNDASPRIVEGAVQLLRVAKTLPGIELTVTNGGVSGYGAGSTGRRECFHIAIRRKPKPDNIVVMQHGEAFDPEDLCRFSQPSNPKIKRGYIDEFNLSKMTYAANLICESYANFTGNSLLNRA
jgi:hypothetical protein